MSFDLDRETYIEQRRVAYWIREWARRRGLSLNRMSMASKVSSPSLYDLLGLRVAPNLRTLVAIAQALEVQLQALFQPVPAGEVVKGVDDQPDALWPEGCDEPS